MHTSNGACFKVHTGRFQSVKLLDITERHNAYQKAPIEQVRKGKIIGPNLQLDYI